MNAKFSAHNGLSDTTTRNLTQTQVPELIHAYLRNFFIRSVAIKFSNLIDRLALTGKSLCDPVALDALIKGAFPNPDQKGPKGFCKALDHVVTLAALISPRLQDGTSVLSYSDPNFQGGFVALTTASRESFVINHDGSGVSVWGQDELYADPTLRKGERVTVEGFPATVVFSEGDTVYARINDREAREARKDREAREARKAQQILEALPRSQVVVSCDWASTTWPPNVAQTADRREEGEAGEAGEADRREEGEAVEAVEADRREEVEAVSFYIGEPVVFRTSDATYTGVVSVLDTDRVVITGAKTGGQSSAQRKRRDPVPVYYVVARNAVERRDEEDAEQGHAKRICTRP
jgi:hypothetical protein